MQKTSLKILGMTALFLCVSCIEQSGTKAVDERMEITEAYNPLNFCGYTPLNSGITVQTPDGDYLYNEKDAEEYYDYYVTSFFFALKIADRLNPSWSSYSSTKHETKEYVRNNLFDIVSNLPLDDSYPNDVVEFVNKIYYDNKDEAATLGLAERNYGHSEYVYDYYNSFFEEYGQGDLDLRRDENNGGRLIIE